MASKVALEKSWHTTQIQWWQGHRPPEPPPKDVVFLLLSLPCLVIAHTDLNTPLNRKLHGNTPQIFPQPNVPLEKKKRIHMEYHMHTIGVSHMVFFSGKNPQSSNPITGHIPSLKLHLAPSSWGRGLENSENATPTVVSSEIATRSAKKKTTKQWKNTKGLPLPLMLISGDSKKNTTATVQILWMFRSKQILPALKFTALGSGSASPQIHFPSLHPGNESAALESPGPRRFAPDVGGTENGG